MSLNRVGGSIPPQPHFRGAGAAALIFNIYYPPAYSLAAKG
jgi:hypothetical protein